MSDYKIRYKQRSASWYLWLKVQQCLTQWNNRHLGMSYRDMLKHPRHMFELNHKTRIRTFSSLFGGHQVRVTSFDQDGLTRKVTRRDTIISCGRGLQGLDRQRRALKGLKAQEALHTKQVLAHAPILVAPTTPGLAYLARTQEIMSVLNNANMIIQYGMGVAWPLKRHEEQRKLAASPLAHRFVYS